MADLADLILEGAAAMVAGALGALARATALADPQPVLRRGFAYRALGEASLGLGGWLIAHACGVQGFWALAAAWACGVLGYAVIHDALLRALNHQAGGK